MTAVLMHFKLTPNSSICKRANYVHVKAARDQERIIMNICVHKCKTPRKDLLTHSPVMNEIQRGLMIT